MVEVWLETGGGSLGTTAKYRTNSGVIATIGTNATPLGSVAPAGAMNVFCNGTSSQLTSWNPGKSNSTPPAPNPRAGEDPS